VVVNPLPERFAGVTWALGATILASGEAVLVLNPGACARAGLEAGASVGEGRAAAAEGARRRVLLAEDSITTRVLERSILEAAGYDVTVAVDGTEAWRLLQEGGADIVVTDVDMPGMDGIALCTAIRASSRYRELPVVLVTSLASDADRRRGLDAGADAYIVKAEFEQGTLLETLARLL
jgi:two-component system chemotaxis sensor kinase CheA